MGQTYARVSASVLNEGINTLDVSGGDTTVTVAISWTVNGFTNSGWFWNDANNLLDDGWRAIQGNEGTQKIDASGVPYSNDEQGLRNYITEKNITNLDDVFAMWNNDASKSAFIITHIGTAIPKSCFN